MISRQRVLYALLACVLFSSDPALATCAVERAPVKTVTDAQAADVRTAVMPASIATLHSMPAPRPLPQDARIAPAETTIYSVTATLIGYRLTPADEIQLVLSDEQRRTMLAVIPSTLCAGGSRFSAEINAARAAFERRYVAHTEFIEVNQPVEVQGVGFFDFLQGQRGLAPNGFSLHPVTAIDFTPTFLPQPPVQLGRRRSVGRGSRSCPRPSFSISASRSAACLNDAVTISWQSNDANARVSIDGIGTALPSSGSRVITTSSSAIYSGRATNACAASDEAVTVVTLTPAPTVSLSGPSTMTVGSSASLMVSVSGGTNWTLTSSLRNGIFPSEGNASRSVTYSAANSGTDLVSLFASGACGSIMRTLTISISGAPSAGLRCCDGTRSPSCFDCNNKRGCCSGHGGVCGCPK
jgi:hypothetical protein